MTRIPDMRRCEASLSAAHYAKKSKAAGTYDQATWQEYDDGHVRCPNKGKVLRRGSYGWVNLCGMHDLMARRTGLYYPYIPPGQSVWQVGVWRTASHLRSRP